MNLILVPMRRLPDGLYVDGTVCPLGQVLSVVFADGEHCLKVNTTPIIDNCLFKSYKIEGRPKLLSVLPVSVDWLRKHENLLPVRLSRRAIREIYAPVTRQTVVPKEHGNYCYLRGNYHYNL